MFQTPQYQLGQLVCHRCYKYRGVIVAVDPQCQASKEWYQNNAAQPNRRQPWYHILEDGGLERYVAEDNLDLDSSGREVRHPLINFFFATFMDGQYFPQSRN